MRTVSAFIPILLASCFAACENPTTPTEPKPQGSLIAISGTVHEQSPIADVPISAVTVEVVEGELNGRSTTTDANGFFSFEGITPRSATLRLTKDGYEERRYQLPQRPAPTTFSEGYAEDIALAALPPVATLDIRIDSVGSKNALFLLSPIRFDASASQAVRPIFTIEFGDGASTTEPVAVHPCHRQGKLTSLVTVTDAFGRTASATSQFRCIGLVPQPGSPGGVERWWSPAGDEPWMFEKCRPPSPAPECSVERMIRFRTQAGVMLTGDYFYRNSSGARSRTFTATLTGERNIRIRLDDGSITFTGDVLLNDYLLPWADARERILRLLANGGADNGRQLDFEYREHDW